MVRIVPIGGGGETSDGDSTSDGDEPRVKRYSAVFTRSESKALAQLIALSGAIIAVVTNPVQFVASVLDDAVKLAFGPGALEILTDPIGAVGSAITILFVQYVILPVVNFILWLTFRVLDILIFIVFGSDQAVGPVRGTFPGFADLLFLLVGVIGQPFGVGTGLVVGFFQDVGAGLSGATEPLGIAAPVVVAGAGTFMLLFTAWALWRLVNIIDVPGVDIVAIGRTIAAPVFWLLRLFGFNVGGGS